MYRGTWCGTVHGVAKSQTQLSDKHFHLLFYMLTTCISSFKHDFTHLKYWFIPNLYLCNLRTNIWEKWDLYYEIRYSVANYNFCYKIFKQDNQIKKRKMCETNNINLHAFTLQFSRSHVSDSLQPYGLQHARLSCPSPTPKDYSNSGPLRQWCHPSSHLLSSPSPTFRISQHQGLFKWVNSAHQVAKVLKF